MSRPGFWKRRQRRWKESWLQHPDAEVRRRGARLDMLFFDHGLLRMAWRNMAEIDEGVWRANQPDPAQIERLAARGLRTVLNLRGATEWGSYLLEWEACAAAGIRLIDFKLSSRSLPQYDEIAALDAIFAEAERPLLMHCKSGADRAGFAAALYLLLRKNAGVAEAGRQLSLRHLHLRRGQAGVMHFMLERYAADTARAPIGFRDWLAQRYDPDALNREFRAGAAAGFVNDKVLRRE